MEALIAEWLQQLGAQIKKDQSMKDDPNMSHIIECIYAGTQLSLVFAKTKEKEYVRPIKLIEIICGIKPEEPYQKKFRTIDSTEYNLFEHELMIAALQIGPGINWTTQGRDYIFQAGIKLVYQQESEITPQMIEESLLKIIRAKAIFINMLRMKLGEHQDVMKEMEKK